MSNPLNVHKGFQMEWLRHGVGVADNEDMRHELNWRRVCKRKQFGEVEMMGWLGLKLGLRVR